MLDTGDVKYDPGNIYIYCLNERAAFLHTAILGQKQPFQLAPLEGIVLAASLISLLELYVFRVSL